MRKAEKAILIRRAIKSLSEKSKILEFETSNPTVKVEFDIIQGKLSAYENCLQLLEGRGLLINLDI